MRSILLLSLLAAATLVSAARAAEAMPSLLCDAATLKAPTQTAAADCPPAPCPPAPCPPEPVCAPAPAPACPPPPAPTCAAAPAAQTREAQTTYHIVPVKRKVYEEETYTVNETRTQTIDEVRTKVIKAKAPRLARVNRGGEITLAKVKDSDRVEPYVKRVKQQYTVPVTRTRKVAKEIEEYEVRAQRRMFGR